MGENKNSLSFGEIASDAFEIGDIVEWTTWNRKLIEWESHYGILVSLKNEIRSNRLVSISKVMPLNGYGPEMEFFTLSLKLVSRSKEEIS